MADEETNETEETTAEAPETVADELETAASEEGAGDTVVAESAEPQEVLAPKERRARKRAAKAPAATGPKTPEERNAERLAARAHKAKLRRNYRQRAKAEARKSQPAPEPDAAPEHGPGRAKVRQGIVVSDKADKTIVVRVDVTRRHRRYGKIMRTSTKLHAHDERNDAGAGDTVRVVECRPMSRTKRWRLTDVLEKAK
jgi:small subunit ribosomal protein S17